MEPDEAITVVTNSLADSNVSATGRTCPQCGLVVPLSVSACPKDGSILNDTFGDGRKIVGNYEFLEFVGSGGMGVIYKAKNPVLKKIVAVKMLHSHLMSDAITKRFQQEAQAVSQLSHRNVIAVHDFGVSEHGQPYMVMDFVEGKPLSEVLRQGSLRLEAVLNIGIQIAEALQHAHDRGVLHRDLKPSNIMVTDYDCDFPIVKIVDFGIAKILETEATRVTQTGELIGTPQYMSPEQCRGGLLDARSDIYSLGCVLYESITGKPPFVNESMVAIIVDQLSRQPRALGEVRPDQVFPVQLEELMSKVLAKVPVDRFQSMNELLASLIDVQKVVVANDGSRKRSRFFKLNRDQRQLLLVSIAAAFSLLSVAGTALLYGNSVHKSTRSKPVAGLSASNVEARIDKVLAREKYHINRYLRSDVMDDAFVKAFYDIDLGIGEIDLGDSRITDKSLQSISLQKNLKTLKLGNTGVTDTSMPFLALLPQLSEINLSRTDVTDKCASDLAKIPKLKILSLSHTKFSDSGVAKLANLPLTNLSLSRTNVTDEGLHSIAKFKTLRLLHLSECDGITGPGLAALVALPIEDLEVDYTKIGDQGLIEISHLPTLEILDISGVSFTAKGIAALSNLQSLRTLNMSESEINVDIIKELGRMPSLASLTLNDCLLSNSVMAAINSNLPNLRSLELRDSSVSDSGVALIQNLSKLETLDIKHSTVSRPAGFALYKRLKENGTRVNFKN